MIMMMILMMIMMMILIMMMIMMIMIIMITLSRKSVRSMHAGGRLFPSCNQDDKLKLKRLMMTTMMT